MRSIIKSACLAENGVEVVEEKEKREKLFSQRGGIFLMAGEKKTNKPSVGTIDSLFKRPLTLHTLL